MSIFWALVMSECYDLPERSAECKGRELNTGQRRGRQGSHSDSFPAHFWSKQWTRGLSGTS